MPSILSIDDSKMMRNMIGGSIEALGYIFREAENGRDGLAVLDEFHDDIELVLLDVNMPVLDGFSVLAAMKQDSRLKDIPVIMVTTEGERARIIQAIRMGAANYVVKPFTPEDLATKILDALGQGF